MVSFRKGWFFSLCFALTLLLGAVSPASAQQVFGRIFGTVTDATGGAVQNAKVTITDQQKGTQVVINTNESGNYDRNQLIPGTYSVSIEAPGFNTFLQKDIQVLVDNSNKIDAALQTGNVQQTVEVTAAAPTLQSDRADVQTTFTAQELVDLPSLNRNAQSYILLAPGTSRASFAHASSEDPQGSVQIQVNGQHFSSTGYQLDGTINQDPILGIVVINPNIDSLQEQKISTQDYDAEFGYVAAGILNASTKSGTNQFHASAFEYFQNNSPGFSDFARNPFSEPNGPPPFKRNQFGGSLGGAIIKDKFFYFGDAELVRQALTGSVTTVVPTALARTGNFSEYLAASPNNAIYDPTTGVQPGPVGQPTVANLGQGRTQFPNNTIPTNRISPQARALLNYFPLPNLAASNPLAPNYAASGAESLQQNKWDTREDYFMNEKTTFFGRYSNHQFQQSAVGAFGNLAGGPAFNGVNFAGNSFVRNQSVAIGTTHTFSPNVVNEFRFGYMKYNVQTTPNGVGQPLSAQAGIPGTNLDPYYTSGLSYFNFGVTSLGYSLGANQCNCPLTEDEGQYQFTDNLTKIAGNHTFKFGADIRYAKNLRVPSDAHRAGEFTFSSATTGVVAPGTLTATDGLSFASFLLGDVGGFARYVSNTTNAAEHQRRWFFYGQDSWRATQKLTVTYGLRWELVFPEEVNGAGNGAQLDLRTGLINVFGVGGVSVHGVQNMNYLNLAPRLGIAYQLNSKTVIRAGYGWSYGMGTFGATFGHNVTQNPPVLFNQTPATQDGVNFESVFTLNQGPPSPNGLFTVNSNGQFLLPNGVGAKARPLDVRLPRTEAYNFTVERQIASNTSVSAAYVGNVGRHVGPGSGDGFNYNVNQQAFIPGLTNLNLAYPFYSKYGWTQGIDIYCQCLNNEYNSFQVQLKRNYASGYGIQASYTYQVATAIAADAFAILYDRPLATGQENSLPNHELTIAQNFDIPFGRGRRFGKNVNRAVDAVLGGWNVSGITTFYSGLPFTPTLSGTATANLPYTGDNTRPNLGTGSPYAANQSRNQWLNIGPGGTLSSAFAVPAANTFGNYGFNTLRGPIFINQDIDLSKNFKLTERLTYQLRGEAYNIFNHSNLGLPNGNVVGDPNGGTITGLAYGYNMRRLQFAMRLDF